VGYFTFTIIFLVEDKAVLSRIITMERLDTVESLSAEASGNLSTK
jgi:hypothetical protein